MDPTAEAFGHGARIFDLAFHPTLRNVIASASEDMTARIWSLQPGSDAYKQVSVCPGTAWLASCCLTCTELICRVPMELL